MDSPFIRVDAPSSSDRAAPQCTFLTSHLLVLLCIAKGHDLRVRDIAKLVGITERTTQAILNDLDRDGYVARQRSGRRTDYAVRWGAPLTHPLVESSTVGDVLAVLSPPWSLEAVAQGLNRHVF